MLDHDAPRLCRVAGRDAWYIYHRRRRISTGRTDRKEAERALAVYRSELDRPAVSASLSVTTLLERHLADRQDAKVPGATRLAYAHKALSRFWGDRPPEAITASECRRYVRRREREGASAGTARTELQAMTSALRWAHKSSRKWIKEIPEIELPPRPEPRNRWLTSEEAARLIAGCAGYHIRLFCLIALHTAARKSAVLGLTWDRVDLGRRLIDFRDPTVPRSNKRRVPLPINDTLLAELTLARAGAETEWVIEWAGGEVASIKRGFRKACIRAGLEGVTPHTLRHTAATWMAQAGIPLWEIAGLLGHSSVQMIEQTYSHHSPNHLRRAANALG